MFVHVVQQGDVYGPTLVVILVVDCVKGVVLVVKGRVGVGKRLWKLIFFLGGEDMGPLAHGFLTSLHLGD